MGHGPIAITVSYNCTLLTKNKRTIMPSSKRKI